MRTAYYSHPDCKAHNMGPGHPECPARIESIEQHLHKTGIDQLVEQHEAPLATLEQLERAHDPEYVRALAEFMEQVRDSGRPRALDGDTSANAGTEGAVLRAAGAGIAATDAVIDGLVDNAFCGVRPCGHHATRSRAMGFCFFNNVAVAARHALDVRGLKRVAIVDFDVHHGNGTEDIIANDERILMVSIFQNPLYPYSGTEPTGDNMVNLPIPPNTKGPAIRDAIEAHWMPALDKFKPEMIFISAGFDAHREDHLGQLGLVESDYAWMTRKLMDVADRHSQGRIVSTLEGGYNLSALARSVEAHLRVLADLPQPA